MEVEKKNYFKFSVAIISCLFLRLIPFRLPNFEPILATQMPFSKTHGSFFGFLFGFLSIVFYDIWTSTFGKRTLFVAITYGVIGVFSALYFKKRKANVRNFVLFAIGATLFFDIATGLIMGPVLFHQTFHVALVGQIPFTLIHLIGNIILATILSPAVYHFILKDKERIKLKSIINLFNPKAI